MASSSNSTINYADGTVVNITMGATELNTILHSATSHNQLVLLDFSASWCGPCKMLAPVLASFATEHKNRLIVCKMDCEQTNANRDLAAQHSISAFPTLKLFRGGVVVETIQGANPPAIRRAIQQQLTLLGSNSGSSGSGSNTTTVSLTVSLARSLALVKQSCPSYEDFLLATKALLTYASNIVDHPDELKYRRIKKSNKAFQERLGSRHGGMECMSILGFKERIEGMEPVLVMDEIDGELKTAIGLLKQALGSGSGSGSGNNSNTNSNTASANAAGSGGGGGLSADSLAQALRAVSMSSPTQASNNNSTATHGQQQQQQPVQRRRPRQIRVSAGMLAEILEKAMIDAGLSSGSV